MPMSVWFGQIYRATPNKRELEDRISVGKLDVLGAGDAHFWVDMKGLGPP